MKKKVIMIDPPSGWKYGFPKPIPDNCEDVLAWMVAEGYPQREIDRMGDYFFCNQWEEEIDVEETDSN